MTREELLQIAKPVLFNTEMTVAINPWVWVIELERMEAEQ